MSMTITKQNEIYFLKGQINSTSNLYFMAYFEAAFTSSNKIKINIEEVDAIDKDGLKALFYVMQKASEEEKTFSIIGYGCKEIYDHFDQNIA